MRTTAPPVTALVNSPIFMLVVYLGSVVSRLSLVFFIFLAIVLVQTGYAGKEEFKEYLKQAKALKDDVAKSSSGFDPKKIFDNYSSNPASAKYYNEESASASQTLRSDSISSLTLNKEGQAIAESSKIRPQFKINHEAAEIKNSNKIQTLAAKNIKGTVEGFLAGEEEQINTTRTKYVIKTCNKEIRPLKRIFIKSPMVSTTLTKVAQPNCKSVVVAQTFGGGCPKGYTQILYSDMIRWETWDDISICTKAVNDQESQECYAGHLVYGISGGSRLVQSTGRATVPKKVYGRLRFSNVYHNQMAVTIVNETTGQTLYNGGKFTNGQVVELPFSDTKDQVFRFYEPGKWTGIGVMVLVFDHLYQEKIAAITWQESSYDL